MCTNGEWRVTQGECTGQEVWITNEQGKSQTVVVATSAYKGPGGNRKRQLLETQATDVTTLAQVQSQGRCEASAGCPMDQTYWLCWPSSYR
jgi:hypothetical protein